MDPKTNTSKFNRYQAEAVIPWVNDVVLYLTIALQTAQQLKDKVIKCLSQLYAPRQKSICISRIL